jgi:steroid delta-isomerase-like uncharacterized protein
MKASLLGTLTVVVALGACAKTGAKTTPQEPVDTMPTSAVPVPTASAEPSAAVSAGPTGYAEMHKAFVANLQSAWAAHDVDKLLAAYPSASRIGMAGPEGWTQVSPTEAKAQIQALMTAFPDSKITPTSLISAGERAVVQWTFTGTHKGELMGEKATDKPVGVTGASFLVFSKDGKVLRENRYMDFGTILGQIGKPLPGGQKTRPVEAVPTAALEVIVAVPGEEAKGVGVLKKYYELTQKRDHPAIAALLAEDLVISNNREAADMTKADFVKLQPSADKAFIDEGTVVKQCLNAGEVGACEYEWTATLKRPAMGMPATGKTGTIHEADVARSKDGKLASVHGYGSRMEWLVAFGALKPKPFVAAAAAAPETVPPAPGPSPAPAK